MSLQSRTRRRIEEALIRDRSIIERRNVMQFAVQRRMTGAPPPPRSPSPPASPVVQRRRRVARPRIPPGSLSRVRGLPASPPPSLPLPLPLPPPSPPPPIYSPTDKQPSSIDEPRTPSPDKWPKRSEGSKGTRKKRSKKRKSKKRKSKKRKSKKIMSKRTR